MKHSGKGLRAAMALLSITLLISLASCVSRGEPAAGKYTPGAYAATVKGFGGPVTVKITVDAKKITEVKAEGPSETKGIGSRALEELPPLMLKAQSAAVDGVSGATYTSNAVKLAAGQALSQAVGKSAAGLSMKDGAYEATARGFNLLTPVAVSVNIAGNKITAITIGKNGETNGMPQVVQTKLVPRIIESQSLAKKNVEYTVDVVVVGMGGSRMAAAMTAPRSRHDSAWQKATLGFPSRREYFTSAKIRAKIPYHLHGGVRLCPEPTAASARWRFSSLTSA